MTGRNRRRSRSSDQERIPTMALRCQLSIVLECGVSMANITIQPVSSCPAPSFLVDPSICITDFLHRVALRSMLNQILRWRLDRKIGCYWPLRFCASLQHQPTMESQGLKPQVAALQQDHSTTQTGWTPQDITKSSSHMQFWPARHGPC